MPWKNLERLVCFTSINSILLYISLLFSNSYFLPVILFYFTYLNVFETGSSRTGYSSRNWVQCKGIEITRAGKNNWNRHFLISQLLEIQITVSNYNTIHFTLGRYEILKEGQARQNAYLLMDLFVNSILFLFCGKVCWTRKNCRWATKISRAKGWKNERNAEKNWGMWLG